MSTRLAAHWTVTGLLASAATVAVPLPFTSPLAGAAGVFAAAGVAAIGYATAPTLNTRKDHTK